MFKNPPGLYYKEEGALMGVPLVELHDHLDGGLRPETLVELSRRYGVALESFEIGPLNRALEQCRGSLVAYLRAFEWTLPVMQEAEDLERIAQEAVEDWARAGVVYGELRMAPQLHQTRGLTLGEVLKAVRRGMEEGTRKTGVEGRLIACALRDREGSLETLEAADKLRDWGVAGFDVAGPEHGWPLEAHEETFRRAREREMPLTIHAGEAAGPESIREALKMGARRLGHAVSLVQDPSLVGEVRRRGIHIEACVSSNLQTKAVQGIQEHPVKDFFKWGLRFSLCTDNRWVSQVDLGQEGALVQESFGFTSDQLKTINLHALEAAFLSEGEKAALRRRYFV